MILACSSCIFDVISRVGGSHLFPIAVTNWFRAHAVTIGSMLTFYKVVYAFSALEQTR